MEVEIRNCRMSPRSAPSEHLFVILGLALLYRLRIQDPARRNRWLHSLLTAELIGEVRGGDSFSDIYGLRRFVEGCLPLLSAALMRCPYVMLPQTYGPFRSRIARELAAFLLRSATTILTRDRNCESTVLQLCGRAPKFCPDVAFTLDAMEPVELPLVPNGLRLNGEDLVIGVNVSGLLYNGGYTGQNMFGLRSEYRSVIDQLVDGLLKSTSAKLLLVPHEFGSEREVEACSAILQSAGSRNPGRVFMLTGPLTERELKWLIGRTDLFIGSRMHACIAALSQFVPAVGLAYSDKFLGVFESAGLRDTVIDLRNADASQVLEQSLWVLEKRLELRETLRALIPAVKHEVFQTFRELLGSMVQRPQSAHNS
jgi:colanic acid/amylovoran biosynthesis protein